MLGKYLENVREKSPLIHNITNYVTVNDCANILLACGASPIMSDDCGEVEEITSICGGLNINIGTLNKDTIDPCAEDRNNRHNAYNGTCSRGIWEAENQHTEKAEKPDDDGLSELSGDKIAERHFCLMSNVKDIRRDLFTGECSDEARNKSAYFLFLHKHVN